MDKSLRRKIKEYYECNREKLKSVRVIKTISKTLDEDDNVISEHEMEAYSCVVETESGDQVAEILYSSYDAHSEIYVTTTGFYGPVDKRKEIEDAWREL